MKGKAALYGIRFYKLQFKIRLRLMRLEIC